MAALELSGTEWTNALAHSDVGSPIEEMFDDTVDQDTKRNKSWFWLELDGASTASSVEQQDHDGATIIFNTTTKLSSLNIIAPFHSTRFESTALRLGVTFFLRSVFALLEAPVTSQIVSDRSNLIQHAEGYVTALTLRSSRDHALILLTVT